LLAIKCLGSNGEIKHYDQRVGWLTLAVASNPVLDSSGTHVTIQMSTGAIKILRLICLRSCSPRAKGKVGIPHPSPLPRRGTL
jgi:hypothetical protein